MADLHDLILKLTDALHDAGAVFESVELGEGFHRCGTSRKPHGKDFSYRVHLDFPPSVTIVNYHDGGMTETIKLWKRGELDAMTAIERDDLKRRIEAERKAARERREAAALSAELKARNILNVCRPCLEHPYLKRKHVEPVARLGILPKGNALVVPMFNADGRVVSLQLISPDGSKRFLKGGQKAGCYFSIRGDASGPLVIAEGLATALAIYWATGHSVIVAFDCGNLMSVAKTMRSRFPDREIVLAADNDCAGVDGKGRPFNAGLVHAREAASAIGGKVAVPVSVDGRSVDFNDLWVAGEVSRG